MLFFLTPLAFLLSFPLLLFLFNFCWMLLLNSLLIYFWAVSLPFHGDFILPFSSLHLPLPSIDFPPSILLYFSLSLSISLLLRLLSLSLFLLYLCYLFFAFLSLLPCFFPLKGPLYYFRLHILPHPSFKNGNKKDLHVLPLFKHCHLYFSKYSLHIVMQNNVSLLDRSISHALIHPVPLQTLGVYFLLITPRSIVRTPVINRSDQCPHSSGRPSHPGGAFLASGHDLK